MVKHYRYRKLSGTLPGPLTVVQLYKLAQDLLRYRKSSLPLTLHARNVVRSIIDSEGYCCMVYTDETCRELLAFSMFSVQDTIHWGEILVELHVANGGNYTVAKALQMERKNIIDQFGGGRYLKTTYRNGEYITKEIDTCRS